MAVITVYFLAVTLRGEGDGDFAYKGLAIVTVRVAPYAVDLRKTNELYTVIGGLVTSALTN